MPVQPSTTVQVPNPDDAGQRDGRPDQEGIAAAKGTDTSEQVATPSMGGSEPNADLEARVETGSHVGASGYVAEDVHLRPGGSSGLAATSPRDTLKASLALGGHSKSDNETTPGKDGQPSSSRLASASPPSIRASSPGDQPLRRSAASRRSHMLASTLLSQLACTICRKSLRDPITIPCGHSVCATCITARVHLAMRAAPSAPCSSHVPPRLPLSTLTLPCPVSACPRGAVGRGLGIWTGHHCRYGAPHPLEERDDFFDSASSSTYPGSPPLDGFITGVQDHPLRLSVIPAQPKGQSHLFALPAISSGSENESTSRSADLLRMDVTLSKALGILRRYADAVQTDRPSRRSTPPRQAQPALGSTAGPSASRRRARVAARGRSRRLTSQARSQRGRAGAGSFRGHDQDSGEPDDRRVQLTRTGAALLGASEADLESGTVGGVRAVSDTEEEDEDDYAAGSRSFDDEEDEEEGEDAASGSSALWPSITSRTGQASAPSPDNRRYRAQHKRRRRTTLPGPAREAAFRTRGLPAETETTESGWDTENSATAASGSLDARKRWQELAEAYDRGGPTDVAKLRPDAQCHGAIGVGATTTFKDKSPPRASHTAEALHAKLLDTLECQLCYCLLYMPLTTPCGHTFCKPCFARSLDHGNKCPLCRTQMPPFSFFQEHPSNAALMRLLISEIDVEALDSKIEEKVLTGEFPPTATYETQSAEHASKQAGATALVDESRESWGLNALYQERKTAVEQEEREARLSTPIFVCTLAFPGMPTILHIFEPRYRLMVRRCLESGNPRFGMVLPSRNITGPVPGVQEYGTMLEIKSVQMLADGRSMLETVGTYRFRLLETGSLDGYMVGRTERFDDIPPEQEAELERAAMARSAANAAAAASAANAKPSTGGERERTPTNASGSTVPPSSTEAPPMASGLPTMSAPSLERDASSQSNASAGSGPTSHNAGTSSRPAAPTRSSSPQPPAMPHSQEPSTAELIAVCTSFIDTLRSGSAPWLMTRLNHTYGPMPASHEVDRLGYWMALVMPIDEHEKAKLLPITSPRLRLRLVVHWIDQLRHSWWFSSGCSIC